MQVKVTKQPKATLQLNITVPAEKVKETYSQVLKTEVTKAQVPGFRKGQAPESIVKEKTDTSELYGEVVNQLLQTYYPQALKENKISPVSNPKVEIKEFDLEKDFEFTATIATRPEVKIKDFRADLKKLHDKKVKEHEGHDHEIHLAPNEVIELLVEKASLDVADLLVEEETDRMMTRIIEQTQTLGMSLEDYLKTQNKTAAELRKDYEKIAEINVKSEFILQHLIDERKIEISEAEVDEAINLVGDDSVKAEMQSPLQKWYIKSVLAKNKLLSELVEEAKGDEKTSKASKKEEK